MKTYYNKLDKYYPKNYFYGLKSYLKRRYKKESEITEISLSELVKKKYDKDVMNLIYYYYKQFKPIMIRNYIRKIKKEFNYRIKYIIYKDFTIFPDDIKKFDWFDFLNKLIIEFVEKYNNHLISRNRVKYILLTLSEEICIINLKAVFVSIIGLNKLVNKYGCSCGCKTFNHYLNSIKEEEIFSLKYPNYFDEMFYKYDLHKLYLNICNFYTKIIELEFELIENKYIRLPLLYNFPDFTLYKKLVSKY